MPQKKIAEREREREKQVYPLFSHAATQSNNAALEKSTGVINFVNSLKMNFHGLSWISKVYT